MFAAKQTGITLRWAFRSLRMAWLVGLCLCTAAAADDNSLAEQYFTVRVWGADESLPVTSVTDVAQTREGYLWIATRLAGVLRFDGCRFTSFSAANTPELRSMGAQRLMVDCTGTLWIALYNSLATWDKDGFQLAMNQPGQAERLLWSAPGRVVFATADRRLLCGRKERGVWTWDFAALAAAAAVPQCCADHDGQVWYLRNDQGLGVWHEGKNRSLFPVPGLEGQAINVLTADATGRIWAGTDQDLALWKTNRFAPMTPTNGEAQLAVKRIIPSGAKSLWVEANGRMRRCEGRRWVAEAAGWSQEPGVNARLRFACGDARGGLWSNFGDLGLLHVDEKGVIRRLTTRDGLPSNVIRFAFPDREGNVWLGYERGGLVQVKRRLFRVIGKEKGLQESLVSSVCADGAEGVWIGTLGGDVVHYTAGQCTSLHLPSGVRPSNCLVAADAQGRLWIGAHGSGLFVYERGRVQRIASRAQLHGDVRSLLPARDGRLWVSTLRAVFTVEGKGFAKVYPPRGALGALAALAESADGTIWAGTLGGHLLRWNGAQFVSLAPPARASLGQLWAFCPDRNGDLWIGTSAGGLLKWSAGEFRRYTTREGLPSDTIVQVLTDDQSNLWMVTDAGIACLSKAALARFDRGELATLPCSVYGRSDGLLTIGGAREFQPNCCRTTDGSLWFAMVNGVAKVRPEEVHFNPVPPTPVVEEAWVDARRVWPARSAAIATPLLPPAARPGAAALPMIRVGPGRRDLEIRYTGLSLGSPERIRFKYKLEGLDSTWKDVGDQRSVLLRYLPPGQYQFQVMACNSDGVWSEQAAALAVKVEPYFYQTAWFQGGAGLFGVAGLVLTVLAVARRRMRRRLEQLERRHQLERERGRIARDLHDDLGAGLTEIGLIGSLAQRPAQVPQRVQEHLGRITDKAREMATSLDEIVWALNPKHDSVSSLSQYFREYAQQFLRLTPIRCRLETADVLPPCLLSSDQRQQLLMVFKEALTNVVRHAQATEVRIAIFVQQEELVVSVADNGRGMASAPSSPQADGLANMSRRLEQIGGRCEIQSQPGGGTAVRFLLPLGQPPKR